MKFIAFPPNLPRAKPYRRKPSEVKALVRFRDGYRCRFCGMTARTHYQRFGRALDVHRLVPGSRYTLRGCVTACRPCHRGQHGCRPKPPGATPLLAFHLPQWLLDIIEAQAVANDRTKTVEVLRALKAYYRAQGLGPPADPES